MPGVETFALKTPDQLDDARAFVDKHGQASPIDASPTWRLVVAPIKGVFTAAGIEVGAELDAGDPVGRVSSLRDTLEVPAAHGGRVIEWLVEDGDPVAPGQPLVRLHPAAPQEVASI
jgi:[acyl-carrier-protein] S-malonyltransferase